MPSKCNCSRSRFHNGVLSNIECGGCTSQPPVRNASIQCMPDLSMLTASALNTWCTRKSRHTRSMAYTECLKCAASEASAIALTAPAEVPVMIGNGHAEPRRNSSAIPLSTPTWYAERAPPPVSTNPK